MSEIKKTENGVTTKYKGVWNATICVEENFTSDEFTEEDLHDLDTAFPAPARKIPLAGW